MERISRWLAAGLVALIVAFCALNWAALTADSTLNFGVAQLQAPLGVILLALTAAFIVLLLVVLLHSRLTALRETRALHRDLHAAHEVAERAEASRFEGLQHLVLTEFRSLNERVAGLQAALDGRRAHREDLPPAHLP